MNNEGNNQVNGFINVNPVVPGGGENNIQGQVAQVVEGNNVIPVAPVDSNNNGGVITPITPITPTMLEPQMSQEGVPNNEVNQVVGAIPISPMPDVKDNMNNVGGQSMVEPGSIISVTPDTIIPQSNGVGHNSNNLENTMVVPELKLDSSSPFDIGVSNFQNDSLNSMMPNQSSNLNQNNVTPIAPVNLNNGEQENNLQSNGGVSTSNSSVVNNSVSSTSDNVVSVGKYLLHMILFSIPLVGFIMVIVKVFDKKDKNISNYAKAQLLFVIIMVVIGIIISVVFSALLVNLISGSNIPVMY